MVKRFLLRLPDELYDRLVSLAREDGRSLNAEIVWLLGRGNINVISPDTHQADTNEAPPVVESSTPLILKEKQRPRPTVRNAARLVAQAHEGALRELGKLPCTCGPGERAKGKHNKHCPARDA